MEKKDWSLPVEKWSEEQLEEWARVNITKDTIPQLDWHHRQVAIWARKVLNFSEKSAKILIDKEVTGHTLSVIKYERFKSYGLPDGAEDSLWAEIEKMKKSLAEPVSLEKKFAGLMIVHSTTVWKELLARLLVRVSPIPTEDQQKRLSSLWRSVVKELEPINVQDKHKDLMTKVKSLMGNLAREYGDIRYWVDNGRHKEGEIYPDLALSQTPTKKSSSTEIRDFSSDQKPPHDKLEWNRHLFIIEVANISEFNALDEGNISLQLLDTCSIRKKIAQIAGYLLKNLATTGAQECYGAITCYSHWLFMKAEVTSDGKFSLVVHDQVLHINPDKIDMEQQTAFSFLLSLLSFVMRASAHPAHLNKVHDTSLALLRTEDNGEICLNTEIVSITSHSVVMKALWPGTHQLVCIKCDRSARNLLANEINVIKRLNAANVPNVPHLTACGTLLRAGEQYACLVTSLYGECIDALLPLPLVEIQHMVSDVLQALQGMHELQLIHSDVKPGNIVRHWNESLGRYCYTLIDFGFSFQEGCVVKDEWGCSIEYASIQMLDGSVPTAKDDFKALWYTVVHVMQGSLPWQRFSAKLTKWAKEAFRDELVAQNNEQCFQLANVYETIDVLPEPYQAWQRWLVA